MSGSNEYFSDYRSHVGTAPSKFYKSTLFRSSSILLGLNCLETGQAQAAHTHDGQDKFYFVIEGVGEFTVGDGTRTAGPGMVIWAPADVTHGVRNSSAERLVILVGISPAPPHPSARV